MSFISQIEWTDATWNPVTGCTKISEGCRNCYAEKLAIRLHRMGNKRYVNKFSITLHEDLLALPSKWKKPRFIFVNSMSDMFHEDIPDSYIHKVFGAMAMAKHHTYQVLTKRSERMKQFLGDRKLPDNIWIGVTVENQDSMFRIESLRKINSKVKFISFEPLLSSIENFTTEHISWVIVGGESGNNARPIEEKWVKQIRDICVANEVPFFFKQWGGKNKKKAGRELEGRIWDQFPVISS